MSYLSGIEALEAKIPPQFLTEALDDNADGLRDEPVALRLLQDTDDEINAILGQRYTVPLPAPVPPIILAAALQIACHTCYVRRGVPPSENPFTQGRDFYMEKLGQIASGELPLTPTIQRGAPSASTITRPSLTNTTGAIF